MTKAISERLLVFHTEAHLGYFKNLKVISDPCRLFEN
jgi:hypothetical protein